MDIPPPAPEEEDAYHMIGFTSLSENTVERLGQTTYEEILKFVLSGRVITSGTRVMGWEDKRMTDGTRLKFSLRKSFRDESAYNLMMKTWQCWSDPHCVEKRFRGAIKVRIQVVVYFFAGVFCESHLTFFLCSLGYSSMFFNA